MKMNIVKAPARIKKKGVVVENSTSIMTPETDGPQFSAQSIISLALTENKSVLKFVDAEILSGVKAAREKVADDEDRCGFDVSPLRKFHDEPVSVTLFDSEENKVGSILFARIVGKPKYAKPEGDKDALLHINLSGAILFETLREFIAHIEADCFVSIESAQTDMFKNAQDGVDAQLDKEAEKKAAQPLKVETKAQVHFDRALAEGEFVDSNQVMNIAHDWAQKRINGGHATKKVILEDVKNAIDFVRVPNTDDAMHVS